MQPQPYSQAYLDTAHLMRRAGFGGTPQEIQAAAERGVQATTRALVDYDTARDPIDDQPILDKLYAAIPETQKAQLNDRLPVLMAQTWWTYRMVATTRPLEEKMVLFWHNHFTSTDGDGRPLIEQNQLYRKHALGNFRTLALAVSKNPEMLKYLNGAQNYKAHPNENYARELMELFTCGRVGPDGKPNYTEDDIKASARAFSGWNMRQRDFFYNPNQHDDTAKTFMGRTGNFNGDDIVDILVSLPATAYYMCHKLFRYFAYDDPEPAVMNALVKTYFDSGYEIKPIVQQILSSNAFYSAKARNAVIKSPADYVIGTVRMLGLAQSFAPQPQFLYGDDPAAPPPVLPNRAQLKSGEMPRRPGAFANPVGRLVFLVSQMRNMGQTLFAPPTVKGWDGGTMWINTDTLQARARFATAVANLPILQDSNLWQQLSQSYVQPAAYSGNADSPEIAKIVDTICYQLGPLQLTPAARQAVLDYAKQQNNVLQCARGILSLVMGTPEYQVA